MSNQSAKHAEAIEPGGGLSDGQQAIGVQQRIDDLLRVSRYLEAYRLARSKYGPEIREWQGPDKGIIASKLAPVLGGHQLQRVLIYRLAERYGDDPEIALLRTFQRLGSCPVARLWLSIKDRELETDDSVLQARWLGLKGRILSAMRDFDRAFELLDQSIRLAPDQPSVFLNLADALAQSDDIEGALKTSLSASELAPLHADTASSVAHYLLQTNQVDLAFEHLTKVVQKTEAGNLRLQLARMHMDRGQIENAERLTKGIEKLFPLADPMRNGLPKRGSILSSIATLRSEVCYHRGDYKGVEKWARLSNSGFQRTIAESLSKNADTGKRVRLDVPFKLQKHVTCAPATLTMLSSFWGIEVDHDKIVDEICYNGTAPVQQRLWATENGMTAREFRVTYDAAKELIDLGIPFGLSTVAPGMGHIQVVCGYDSRRGTLLIQDPGTWCVTERLPSEMIDGHRAFGPRGLVLVPKAKSDLLGQAELPDATAFDQQYEISLAFESHDRERAESIVQQRVAADRNDWLTIWAELDLARYDANLPLQLELVRRLRTLFPDNDVLWLWETDLMRVAGRPDQIKARLREGIAENRAISSTRISLISLLDSEWEVTEREELLRVLLRDAPMSPGPLSIEADRLWNSHEWESALELYRLAAMSGDLDEAPARDYLIAARRLDKQETVLEILRNRFIKNGDSSHRPGIAYAIALDEALRTDEAIDVIHQTLARRPSDAELVCRAATILGRFQTPEIGMKLLDETETTLPAADELRARAVLAEYDARPKDALNAYAELAKQQPLNPDLSIQIASLLTELEGDDAAIKYLKRQTDKYPHCRSLLGATAQFMGGAARYAEAISLIDRMIVTSYGDAWCWRQRSSIDRRCGWYEQSLEDAERAVEFDRSAESLTARGDALVQLNRDTQARNDFWEAIQLNCDHAGAIQSWMLLCRDDQDRQEALTSIYDQLVLQKSGGAGMAAYYDFASTILDSWTLTTQLRKLCELRNDNYTGWMLLASHYTQFRQNEEAEKLLVEMEPRFGSRPGFWAQYANLYQVENQHERAIEVLKKGLELHPHDTGLSRHLASLYRKDKRFEDAQQVLRRAIQGAPGDPTLMVALAESIEDKQESLRLARLAAMRASGSSHAWAYLLEIARKNGCETDAVDAARELVDRRPHDVAAYLRLAEMLHREDQWEESLQVIGDALVMDRRDPEIHYLFAKRLFERNYFEKALDACSPPDVDPIDMHSLKVFSTRILYATGESGIAIQCLREALHRDPSDLDNWICLADWAEDTGNNKLYDEATRVLVRRGGHLAVSHSYYAKTLKRENRQDRAIEHLQYALELEPDFEIAMVQLMEIMIGENKLPDLEKYIDANRNRFSSRMLSIADLLIASAHAEAAQFVSILKSLPPDAEGKEDQIAIATVVCEYVSRDHLCELGKHLTKAIKKRKANKAVGYIWAHYHCTAHTLKWEINKFLRLRPSEGRNIAAAYLLSVLRFIADDIPGAQRIAYMKTQKILKRLGKHVYRDAGLWSHAMWVLMNHAKYRHVLKLAQNYSKVDGRSGEHCVPAILACLYSEKYRVMDRILKDVESMEPDKITEECRLLRAMYLAINGRNEAFAEACQRVNKNELSGAFLNASKLLSAGLVSLQEEDATELDRVWKNEFVRKNSAGDPIDIRIFQLLQARVAEKQGNKRLARKWRNRGRLARMLGR